jgi:hypothetical protein
MNNWIKDKEIPCYDSRVSKAAQEPFEAIPVSALEELFSKDGEQLAREMFPIPKPSPENATERIIKSGIQVGFEEAYNLQEVKIAELKKEVEELSSLANAVRKETGVPIALAKKAIAACMDIDVIKDWLRANGPKF